MLPGFMGSMMIAGAAPSVPGKSLIDMLTDAGRLSGLRLALDPADIASWSGSGNWLDTSGQGNHYQALTGEGGGDPTYNGSPGGLSANEYWTGDGTSFDLFDETTAQTFAEPFHQNGATFTFMGAFGLNGDADLSSSYLFNDGGNVASSGRGIGVRWALDAVDGPQITLQVFKGSSPAALLVTSAANSLDANFNIGGWNVVGLSVNEASGSGGVFYLNGVSVTFNPTYSSPSGTAAGTIANSILRGPALVKRGCLAAWNTALGSAGMGDVYAQLKTRYPGLP